MRWRLLLPFVLSGCTPGFAGDPAGPNALRCAESLVANLGYRLNTRSDQADVGAFTAQKQLPSDAGRAMVGEISVLVWREQRRGEQMRVSPSRYERLDGMDAPVTVPTSLPGMSPRTPRSPVPASGQRTRTRGHRRLSPGPVAADAELVRQQCGGRSVREAGSGSSAGGAPLASSAAARVDVTLAELL